MECKVASDIINRQYNNTIVFQVKAYKKDDEHLILQYMKNEDLQNQNDENDFHTKKRILNEIDNQSEEKVNDSQPITDDEYLKHVMTVDIPKEAKPIRSQTHVSGNRWQKPSELTEKEYFEIFFKIPKENASKGRSVYIRPEFHQKFLKLIAGLEIERLTIYAYVDNIIEHHFKEFDELIQKIYQDRNRPMF